MDNLKLQITPIEITYNSKESLPLSCLIKRVAITTGHNLEKQEIKSSGQSIPGRTNFTEAATFTMSKEFELSNTKLSLHFMSKKDRNISCIGSAEVDVATLPNQPLTIYELKLDNCSDPKARLKLQIQRKEKVPDMRKAKERIEEMGSLQTEGLQKETYLQGRKPNPNVPSAYEISRRNYKQPVVTRQDERSSSKHGSRGKNILNQKQLNTTISHAERSSNSKNSIASKKSNQSPMPRQKTPEPIKLNPLKNQEKAVNNQQSAAYPMEGQSKLANIKPERIDSKLSQDNIEKPEVLGVKPYQQRKEAEQVTLNNQNMSNNTSIITTQQKYKYQPLTDKLQQAHNKILTNKSKVNNSSGASENSSPQSFSHQNFKDYQSSHFDSKPNILHDFHTLGNQQNKRQSQLCSATFNFCQVPHKEAPLDTRVILESSKSSLEGASTKPTMAQQSRSYKPPASSITAHSQQTSPYSQKSNLQDSKIQPHIEKLLKYQIEQMERQNKELILQNQQYSAEINHYRDETNELRSQISKYNRKLADKDYQINRLNKELTQSKSSLNQKQSLLAKISNDYDHKFEQLEEMKQQMDRLKQELKYSLASQTLQRASLLSVEGERQSKRDQLSEDLAQTKKMLLDVETQLRMRDNQIRYLRLDIDNFKREKKDLEQQIDVLSRNNKQDFVRQRSIAHINQLTNNSITHNTKRQNQALKTQIKLLQQKLQSLNILFQSLISPNQLQPQPKPAPNIEQIRYEQRNKCLEQKVLLLQEQLKSKKNLMAEMINIIWKHGDAQIMDDIDHLMGD